MTPIQETIINKKTTNTPLWLMRQAGRYLPEFRKIRKANTNFINLCLNEKLSAEITLQPLKRFDLDAAIIFSDILMIPYGLKQNLVFEKNFGPKLGSLDLQKILSIDEIDFLEKLYPLHVCGLPISRSRYLQVWRLLGQKPKCTGLCSAHNG